MLCTMCWDRQKRLTELEPGKQVCDVHKAILPHLGRMGRTAALLTFLRRCEAERGNGIS